MTTRGRLSLRVWFTGSCVLWLFSSPGVDSARVFKTIQTAVGNLDLSPHLRGTVAFRDGSSCNKCSVDLRCGNRQSPRYVQQSPCPFTQFLITSVPVAVRVRAPLVPVTVKTLEPGVADVVVVTVNVEELAVAGFGLKVPLAPVPRPLTENVTEPVNPPLLVMLTV